MISTRSWTANPRVVVGIDGSQVSTRALEWAAAQAEEPGRCSRPMRVTSLNRLVRTPGVNQPNTAVATVAPSGETSWATRTASGETPRGATHAP